MPNTTVLQTSPAAGMPQPTPADEVALEIARAMAGAGIPLLVGMPNPHFGEVDPEGRVDPREFIEPSGWQNAAADPAVVDQWRPGYMLAAVTGVAADVIDTDPRHGGSASRSQVEPWMPRVYGVVRTPRGGTHEWVGRLGVGKRSGAAAPLPGLDVLAGDDSGKGRGYVRIPPTVNSHGAYSWEEPLDLQALARHDRASADGFRDHVLTRSQTRAKEKPPRPGDLPSYLQNALEAEVAAVSETAAGGRNDQLNRSAFNLGQLIAEGLPEDDIRHALTHAAEKAGLNGSEIHETLESGLASGKAAEARWEPAPEQAPDSDLVDLASLLSGHLECPLPDILRFGTDRGVFYSGKVNAIIGEPESGKSWLAVAATAEVLSAGGTALYVDLEDSASTLIERLRALGADDQAIAARLYCSVPETKSDLLRRIDWAASSGIRLVVIDSFGGYLALSGSDSMSNDDVTRVLQADLAPVARSGACLLLIDHVTKSKEQRGRYAIGAQSKLAGISGTSICAQAVTPLGRNRTGRIKLTVGKDRPGHVRGAAAQGSIVGIASVTSLSENTSMSIDWENADHSQPFRPTALMQRVSEYVRTAQGPVSRNQIEMAVKGKSTYVRDAIARLVAEGFLEEVPGGSHTRLRHVRAYSADTEFVSSALFVPDASQGGDE